MEKNYNPKNKRIKTFDIYAYDKSRNLNKACSFEAKNQNEAKEKGKKFCKMMGYTLFDVLQEKN